MVTIFLVTKAGVKRSYTATNKHVTFHSSMCHLQYLAVCMSPTCRLQCAYSQVTNATSLCVSMATGYHSIIGYR